MAAEFDDKNIPIDCPECNVKLEGIPATEQHALTHGYTPQEAKFFARLWADSTLDGIDAENAMRAEEFRRTGVDPYNPPSDRDPL